MAPFGVRRSALTTQLGCPATHAQLLLPRTSRPPPRPRSAAAAAAAEPQQVPRERTRHAIRLRHIRLQPGGRRRAASECLSSRLHAGGLNSLSLDDLNRCNSPFSCLKVSSGRSPTRLTQYYSSSMLPPPPPPPMARPVAIIRSTGSTGQYPTPAWRGRFRTLTGEKFWTLIGRMTPGTPCADWLTSPKSVCGGGITQWTLC